MFCLRDMRLQAAFMALSILFKLSVENVGSYLHILFSTIKMKSESYDMWTGFKMLSFELVFSEHPELLCRLDGETLIFNCMCEFYGS